MNKAFVREPEFDGRAYCPQCGSLGIAVQSRTLDELIQAAARSRLTDSAWFCEFPRCDVAYFNLFEAVVRTDELRRPIWPKDPSASICACFPFTREEVEADAREEVPVRIRELLAKSKTPDARCAVRAADGRCCLREVQRLYMKLRQH